VLALVMLPALAPLLKGGEGGELDLGALGVSLALTLGKMILFMAVMMLAGRRFIPWMLARVARIGSRELFTLAVLGTALGIAYAAGALFGVSFALGAFLAGVVASESKFSHQVAEDALPFQDAFAVLFFVSVGMLFNPAILIQAPLLVLGTALIIIVAKTLVAFLTMRLLKASFSTALTVAISLAQIGEFSFILATLGRDLDLLSAQGQNLILAGAIVSIIANPFLFRLIPLIEAWQQRRVPQDIPQDLPPVGLTGHALLIGYGRVGRLIAQTLREENVPLVVVEQDERRVDELRAADVPVIYGDAARTEVLQRAGIAEASVVIIAMPDGAQAELILEHVRRVNPDVHVTARTHDEHTQRALQDLGANDVLYGEYELGLAMGDHVLQSLRGTQRQRAIRANVGS